MNPIPRWLRTYLQESDLERIHQLVRHIEQKTDAELVPIVVRSSLDLKLVRALFLSLSLVLTLILGPLIHSLLGWKPGIVLDIIYFFVALILALLAWWASTNPFFIRRIYNKNHLEALVFRRACGEFFENRLHHTQSRTAVLFMYSVLERKAMIIADPNLRTFPSQVWETAVSKMIESAKNNNFTLGFTEAFEHCASELSKLYPPKEINKNEFNDHLLIKE